MGSRTVRHYKSAIFHLQFQTLRRLSSTSGIKQRPEIAVLAFWYLLLPSRKAHILYQQN
jgi:hypothetical protein